MKYFDWTEEKNYTLALLLLKYKGYKTTDIKQLEKWETMLDKIKTKPEFDDSFQEIARRDAESMWNIYGRREFILTGRRTK
jgi:hypothetical protein